MKRFLLALLLLLPSSARAQFTIPNSNTPGVNPSQSLWMQADVDALVLGIKGTGVLSGCAVTWSSGHTFNVAAGSIQINGATVAVSSTSVTLQQANGSRHRFDLIVVNSSGAVSVVQGSVGLPPTVPSLPASRVLLATVFVPAASQALSADRVIDKRVMVRTATSDGGTSAPATVLLTDYGAVCDGSTDDTAAIQAAFDAAASASYQYAGTVLWPAKTCRITSGVTIGNADAPLGQVFVSIQGAGPAKSKLSYDGASDGIALLLKRNKYFTITGFQVVNAGSRGTTRGLVLGGYGGVGTETLQGHIDRSSVSGFYQGIAAGMPDGADGAVASSDMLYTLVELENNTYGWINDNWDLNILNHTFLGLNLAFNTYGLKTAEGNVEVRGGSTTHNDNADFWITGGNIAISEIRAEVKNRFLLGSAGNVVTVRDCLLQPSGAPSDIVIELLTTSATAITNTRFTSSGTMSVHADSHPRQLLLSNNYYDAEITWPFVVTNTTYVTYPMYLEVVGTVHAFNQRNLPDYRGTYTFGDTSLTPGPLASLRCTPYPVLNAFANPEGNIWPECFVRQPSLGLIPSAGRNLRVQRQFATSGTVAVTFARTVAITYGSPVSVRWNVVTGTLYPSDLGLKIAITQGENTIPATISDVNTSNSTFLFSTNTAASCGSCSSLSAVIGENEPDANYLVQIGCSAQETVSWSSKATTGFTLTSSNSSSTATCDVVIVR